MFSASNCRNSASVTIRFVADVATGLCRLGVGDTVGNSMVSRPPSAVMIARSIVRLSSQYQAWFRSPEFPTQQRQKMLSKQWDIVGPFSERWQLDRKHA
jgi:hypothetical protein